MFLSLILDGLVFSLTIEVDIMLKCKLVFGVLIIFCLNSLAQDGKNEETKDTLSNYYGRFICLGAAIPIGIFGSIMIGETYMDAPKDSILYPIDNGFYRVSDFNSDVTLKLGAFILVDILVFYIIGDKIDDYRKKRRLQKGNEINIIIDPNKNNFGIVSKWVF
jgi:hypothetical protein